MRVTAKTHQPEKDVLPGSTDESMLRRGELPRPECRPVRSPLLRMIAQLPTRVGLNHRFSGRHFFQPTRSAK
ncbi:hypothetical protein J6590_005912 [Homalodisca vitripennis]|nr:hypothetical protein J6590_005912 [Homalodisca vitripennis]